MATIYKYDKSNRLIVRFVESLMHLTIIKYKKNFRKLYFFCKNQENKEIIRENLVNQEYKKVSSIVIFDKIKVFIQYNEFGDEILERIFTKNKTIYEKKLLLKVNNSVVQQTTFIKNNKTQKNITIKIDKNGRNK